MMVSGRTWSVRVGVATLLVGAGLAGQTSPPASGAPDLAIVRVAESPTGGAAAGYDSYTSAEVSVGGRYVSYTSAAAVVPEATTRTQNAFVRDADLRSTRQLSLTPLGNQPEWPSRHTSMSADGSVIAFASLSPDLDPTDEDQHEDVFAFDRTTGTKVRLSKPRVAGSDNDDVEPIVSGNGRYVVFQGWGTDLIGGGTDGVMRYDLETDALVRVALGDDGLPASSAHAAAVSADGTKVLFSGLGLVVDGVEYETPHLFVRNLVTGDTRLVPGSDPVPYSVGTLATYLEAEGLGLSDDGLTVHLLAYSRVDHTVVRRVDLTSGLVTELTGVGTRPLVSVDGQTLVYSAEVAGITQIYARNMATGTSRLVSKATGGSPGNGDSYAAGMSRDGRYVLLVSEASNLIPSDSNGRRDLFRADLGAVPDVPRTLKAAIQRSSVGTAKVTWTAPAANGTAAVTGYRVKVSTGGLDDSIDRVEDQAGAATSMVVTGLEPGRAHRFLVSARNGAGYGSDTAFSGFVVPPWQSFDSVSTPVGRGDGLIPTIYTWFAGRLPTSAEVAADANTVLRSTNGTMALIERLSGASWTRAHVDPIVRIYQAFFLRLPDSGGLRYWIGRSASGLTIERIANTFVASSEFKNRYGGSGDEAFVRLVYSNVLGRSPDQGGLSYWVAKLRGGMARGALMASFSESAEHVRRTSPTVGVTRVYFGLLDRAPSTAELARDVGRKRIDVITDIVGGRELSDRVS